MDDENLLELDSGWLRRIVKVLNPTGLLLFKWLILFYMNFTSFFFFRKMRNVGHNSIQNDLGLLL